MPKIPSNKPRILMLGTNVASSEMVTYAQSQGGWVMVTDNRPEKHGAKLVADAIGKVSTRDIEGLIALATSIGATAVLSGVNEGNIRAAISVSEQLSLPYHCDSAQWESLMDKGEFRTLCERYSVPAPRTFYAGNFSEAPGYPGIPVVVKPTDGSALRGVSICNQEAHYAEALLNARKHSLDGRVIVEEYLTGSEFTATFAVVNGTVTLSTIDDRYPLLLESTTATFPIARIYPSLRTQEFIETCVAPITALVEAIGLTNACVFFQGIFTSEGPKVFEAGLRMPAETPYRFLEPITGNSHLKHLVDSVIGTGGTYMPEKDDPYLHGGAAAILSFISDGGKIGSLVGVEGITGAIEGIVDVEQRYRPGDTVPADGTLRQIVMRFVIIGKDYPELQARIDAINDRVDVRDPNGESIVHKFDGRIVSTIASH